MGDGGRIMNGLEDVIKDILMLPRLDGEGHC